MAYVYRIINPKGKVYVGSTRDINIRKRNYKGLCCKKQTKLYNSLKKYGWDRHLFEVLEEVSIENMYIAERKWQEFYKVVERGLNCVYVNTADKPAIYSEDTRKKMSDSRKGLIKSPEWQEKITAALQGRTLSLDHRKKISMTKLGVKESEEVRLKKSKAHIGKKHSQETIEKIRKGQNNKKVFSKEILQYSQEGELLKEWKNCKEASDCLHVSINYLRDAARGQYNHKAHGFLWKYKLISSVTNQ